MIKIGTAVLLPILLCAQARANPVVEFMGRLADASGKPMAGHHLLHFKLFGAGAQAPEQWQESLYVKTVAGEYKIVLGRLNPLPENALRAGYRMTVNAPTGTGWNASASAAPKLLAPPAVTSPPGETVSTPAPTAARAQAPAGAASGTWPSNAQVGQASPAPSGLTLATGAGLPQPRLYEVKPGDTLRSIALEVYGDSEKWIDLYQANDDRIQRGGDLTTGQKLIVPRDSAAAPKP